MLQEIVVYSSSLRNDSLKLIRDFQVKKSRLTDMATTLFKTQKGIEKYSDGRFTISTKKKIISQIQGIKILTKNVKLAQQMSNILKMLHRHFTKTCRLQ